MDHSMVRRATAGCAAGLDVSGLTRAAAHHIQQRFDTSARTGVLSAGNQHWTIPVEDLGLSFDAEATVENAYRFGRTGSLWTDSAAWLVGLVRGYTMPSAMDLDNSAVVPFLQNMAPTVTSPPIDAGYVFDKEGDLTLDPDAAGTGLMSRLRCGRSERRSLASPRTPWRS